MLTRPTPSLFAKCWVDLVHPRMKANMMMMRIMMVMMKRSQQRMLATTES